MKYPLLKSLACTLALFLYAGANAESSPPPKAKTTQAAAPKTSASEKKPIEKSYVKFETSMGDLVIELYPNEAPISVENFIRYVEQGFYNDIIFHRIVPGFVVQGGGFDKNFQRRPTQAPIKNESDNGLKNLRGTLSLARTNAVDSATSQFFINLQDNPNLDFRNGRHGYAVFGKVIEGMEHVDKMVEAPQGKHSGVFINAPNEIIFISKASVIKDKGKSQKKVDKKP